LLLLLLLFLLLCRIGRLLVVGLIILLPLRLGLAELYRLLLLRQQGRVQIIVELPHRLIPGNKPNKMPPKRLHTHIRRPPHLQQERMMVLLDKPPDLIQRHLPSPRSDGRLWVHGQ
jgi:hypothetical protein